MLMNGNLDAVCAGKAVDAVPHIQWVAPLLQTARRALLAISNWCTHEASVESPTI